MNRPERFQKWRSALLLIWAMLVVSLAAREESIPPITISGPSLLAPATQAWISELTGQSPPANSPQSNLSRNDRASHAWQRFELSTADTNDRSYLWLTIDATVDYRVDAYLVVDERVVDAAAAGYSVPINNRETAVTSLTLPLKRWTTDHASVYFRLNSLGPRPLSPRIQSTFNLMAEHNKYLALDFAYFGAFGLIILIRAILFANLRAPASRDYLALSIGLMIGVLARGGYWDLLVAPELHLPLLGDFRFMIRTANSILAWRCVHSFFELERTAPQLSRVIRTSTWVALSVIVTSLFVPPAFAVGLSTLVQLIACLLITGACIVALSRKLPGALPTTIAWSLIVASTLLVSLMAVGLLPSIGPELATRLSIIALLWEGIANTATLAFRFCDLQATEHLAALRQQQASFRQQLLRLLSHDILSPTAVIRNAVWLLRRGAARTEESPKFDPVAMIDQAAREIQDITAHVRELEIGTLSSSDLEPVNVVPAIEAAIASIAHQAEAKKVTITTHFPGTDVRAWAQARLLKSSVVTNALTNAIKFSQPGGVVTVSVTPTQHEVVITIEDRGVGIPPEDRKLILKLDALPVSRLGTQNEKGTGFGLQIMSHVIREMGGSLTIHSRTAEEPTGPNGTRVVISLRSAEKTAASSTPHAPTGGLDHEAAYAKGERNWTKTIPSVPNTRPRTPPARR